MLKRVRHDHLGSLLSEWSIFSVSAAVAIFSFTVPVRAEHELLANEFLSTSDFIKAHALPQGYGAEGKPKAPKLKEVVARRPALKLSSTKAKPNIQKPIAQKPAESSKVSSAKQALPFQNAKPALKSQAVSAQKESYALSAVASSSVAKTKKPDSIFLKSAVLANVQDVELALGKAKTIDLKKPAIRVAVSNPDVAGAVIISPTQIQLIGKRVGVTNVLIWTTEGSDAHAIVDVQVHRDVSVLAKQIRYIAPSVNVIPMAADDSVLLTGTADSIEEAQLAIEVAKAFFFDDSVDKGGLTGGISGAVGSIASGSGGGGSAGGGSGGGNGANSSGSAGAKGYSSYSPGSSFTLPSKKIVNLIKVKGYPSTKLELVRNKLKEIDPRIKLDLIPGPGGAEKAILTGRVATSGLISKAVNAASIFYGEPGIKVLTGPGGKIIRQSQGTQDFQTSTAFNDNLDINLLQGSVVTDTSGNVVSMLEVAMKPQIKCTIRFMDMSRQTLKQLGSTLAGNIRDVSIGQFNGAQLSATGRPISVFGGATNISNAVTGIRNPQLKTVSETSNIAQTFGSGVTQLLTINQHLNLAISAFIDNRKVRSLAEPTITLMSGEKAGFLAGGEVPIPVTGNNGQITITFHEFGIKLNLMATVMDDGKINMQVAPEVSTVDATNSITTSLVTIPGFKTRRMQTTLEMADGQSLLMAGLFNQEDNEGLSRLPGVGDLPIIGPLFQSKFADKRVNELVVIISPEVIWTPVGEPMIPEVLKKTANPSDEGLQETIQSADNSK